jgi:hypothetical protein
MGHKAELDRNFSMLYAFSFQSCIDRLFEWLLTIVLFRLMLGLAFAILNVWLFTLSVRRICDIGH